MLGIRGLLKLAALFAVIAVGALFLAAMIPRFTGDSVEASSVTVNQTIDGTGGEMLALPTTRVGVTASVADSQYLAGGISLSGTGLFGAWIAAFSAALVIGLVVAIGFFARCLVKLLTVQRGRPSMGYTARRIRSLLSDITGQLNAITMTRVRRLRLQGRVAGCI